MSTRFTFTEAQQEELRRCPHVRSCSARTVQFTSNFKRHVLKEYARGMSSDAIFREAGIPMHLFRSRYAQERIKTWRAIAKRHGMECFDTEQRGKNGVVTLLKWRDREKAYAAMSDKEKIELLEAEVEALKEIRRRFQLPPLSRQDARSSRRRTSASSSDV